MRDKITSEELYLEFGKEEVVKTKQIKEVNAGIYPTYYLKDGDCLKVSNSVVNLVKEKGRLDINESFQPPNYFKRNLLSGFYEDNIFPKISNLRGSTRLKLLLEKPDPGNWYESWETIDNNIQKLEPFQKITTDGDGGRDFSSDYSFSNQELVKNTAKYLEEYINRIERKFPEHEHVILMGGRDSQLIGLVPKVTDNWSIFSSEPNHSLVKEFVKKNDIEINNLFHHDGKNYDTSTEFLEKKILATDLYSDPRHLRWRPKLSEISDKFDGKCIFWGGTAADAIYSYLDEFHEKSKEGYFEEHFTHVAIWQSNSHQATKNLINCPQISPYHSKEMWEKVYRNYDPGKISEGMDLRPQIGRELTDGEPWFPDENPRPTPVEYGKIDIDDFRNRYIEMIERELKKEKRH